MLTKSKRSFMAKLATTAILAGSLSSTTRASAGLLPDSTQQLVDFVKQAYGYYSSVVGPLVALLGGPAGPDLATQLSGVETAILNELRTQRNQLWRANAQVVMDNFEILGYRQLGDPTNETLRGTTTDLARQTINYYAIIVEDGLDVPSSYQLLPTFDALSTVYVGLIKMKGEIKPKFPAPWGEYDIFIKRTMQANYKLVGARIAGCWPGYNPGQNHYAISTSPGYLPRKVAPMEIYSDLWNKKLAGWWTVPVSSLNGACNVDFGCHSGNMLCFSNSAADAYTLGGGAAVCRCEPAAGSGYSSPLDLNCRMAAMKKIIAEYTSTGPFGRDSVVKVARQTMKSILSAGGGDDRWSGPDLTLPAQGMLTDPWVYEPHCPGPTGPFDGPWAYPTKP
jgi:hypothetical protein